MSDHTQPYDDIPGTQVFDAQASRQGYWLNMFCMSLMQDANRKEFKADEPKYLDAHFPHMTAEQREMLPCDNVKVSIHFLHTAMRV